MIRNRALTCIAVLTMLFPFGWGHVDDPKAQDSQPPYQGPGYRNGAFLGAGPDFPRDNMVLLAWLPLNELAPNLSNANDCWGYVSPSGREYAIIGTNRGTGFVEITNPTCPNLIAFIDGPVKLWRDIKVFQHYAYAVSEGGGGIQVFDLAQVDDGLVSLVNTVNDVGTDKSHNVAIDTTSGFLYRCGGGDNGLRIYSLSDPVNPTFVGQWVDRYVHDAQIHTFTSGPYAGRQIAFCCAGFNGGSTMTGLSIVDVTDKDNIFVISHYEYPNGNYSHQGWLSDDGLYFYLNDELDERNINLTTTTHVLNVADLSNPFQAGTFTNGSSAIDHNLYVSGNRIFQANYRSGLRVFDSTNPTAPMEMAYFDTYPDNDSPNFNGLWSCYPYFPSKVIIGSDIEKGLFVWGLSSETTLPMDINGDSQIDELDLAIMIQDWNTCTSCKSDLNHDGTVDVTDTIALVNAISCE